VVPNVELMRFMQPSGFSQGGALPREVMDVLPTGNAFPESLDYPHFDAYQ
jgi:hypothetical protein